MAENTKRPGQGSQPGYDRSGRDAHRPGAPLAPVPHPVPGSIGSGAFPDVTHHGPDVGQTGRKV